VHGEALPWKAATVVVVLGLAVPGLVGGSPGTVSGAVAFSSHAVAVAAALGYSPFLVLRMRDQIGARALRRVDVLLYVAVVGVVVGYAARWLTADSGSVGFWAAVVVAGLLALAAALFLVELAWSRWFARGGRHGRRRPDPGPD
jgi:hypothetical protein